MDISIVIVTNNHEQYIGKCLDSCLQSLNGLDGEIIVIDNLSDDTTPKILKEYKNKIILKINNSKKGFSANHNVGIKISKGKYILVLNPDTSLQDDTLKKLIAIAKEKDELGLLAPMLKYPNGGLQYSCRRFPGIRSTIIRRTPLRRILGESITHDEYLMKNISRENDIDVDWVIGACMLIPRSTIDKIGGFDERYFLYVEDIDFCYRIHREKMRVVYTPKVSVIHDHMAVTYKKLFSIRTYYHYLSIIKFFWKYKFSYNYFKN